MSCSSRLRWKDPGNLCIGLLIATFISRTGARVSLGVDLGAALAHATGDLMGLALLGVAMGWLVHVLRGLYALPAPPEVRPPVTPLVSPFAAPDVSGGAHVPAKAHVCPQCGAQGAPEGTPGLGVPPLRPR